MKSLGEPVQPIRSRKRVACMALLTLLGMCACQLPLIAQQAPAPTDSDKETIRLLLQRIQSLETRVSQLEAAEKGGGRMAQNYPPTPTAEAAVPAAQKPPTAATPQSSPAASQSEPEAEQQVSEASAPERMDLSKTLLRIRGFGDITLHGSDQQGDTTSFSLGQLDLFVTSDLSEKFKFLSEIVFEGGPENAYGVTTGETNHFNIDVERYLLQYSQNDYLNISVGRYHTAIGYYNTAYHHSTWLQTTTGRPLVFEFEDQGGLLPIHNVGLSVNGLIPSGRLGLHYVAEIGNGRASRNPLADEPVQNEIDENNHKAFNLALFARPDAVQGLQIGFSGYHDVLTPGGGPRVGETILDAYGVVVRPNLEWLNEALLIRHSPFGQPRVFNTPAFYTQISRRFASYRPYFRYQYVNGDETEPIFPDIGLRHGPSLGIRYDASESVALKLQYDHTFLRDKPATNGLGMQVGFTF
jgi:hypothetical protein